LRKVAIRRGLLSANSRATFPFFDFPVPLIARMVQLFRRTLSIVMMHRLPFGTWLNYIVRINSMTHHFGEPMQFTFNAMSFAVGVGPLFGSR